MMDAIFVVVVLGTFTGLSWGLIALCDRLQGGGQ